MVQEEEPFSSSLDSTTNVLTERKFEQRLIRLVDEICKGDAALNAQSVVYFKKLARDAKLESHKACFLQLIIQTHDQSVLYCLVSNPSFIGVLQNWILDSLKVPYSSSSLSSELPVLLLNVLEKLPFDLKSLSSCKIGKIIKKFSLNSASPSSHVVICNRLLAKWTRLIENDVLSNQELPQPSASLPNKVSTSAPPKSKPVSASPAISTLPPSIQKAPMALENLSLIDDIFKPAPLVKKLPSMPSLLVPSTAPPLENKKQSSSNTSGTSNSPTNNVIDTQLNSSSPVQTPAPSNPVLSEEESKMLDESSSNFTNASNIFIEITKDPFFLQLFTNPSGPIDSPELSPEFLQSLPLVEFLHQKPSTLSPQNTPEAHPKKKKRVSFAPDDDLCKIKYIESNLNPMHAQHEGYKGLDKSEAIAAYNLGMQTTISWRIPKQLIFDKSYLLDSGSGSKEKKLQETRERSVLTCFFMNKDYAPSTPSEVDNSFDYDPTTHTPLPIPLKIITATPNSEPLPVAKDESLSTDNDTQIDTIMSDPVLNLKMTGKSSYNSHLPTYNKYGLHTPPPSGLGSSKLPRSKSITQFSYPPSSYFETQTPQSGFKVPLNRPPGVPSLSQSVNAPSFVNKAASDGTVRLPPQHSVMDYRLYSSGSGTTTRDGNSLANKEDKSASGTTVTKHYHQGSQHLSPSSKKKSKKFKKPGPVKTGNYYNPNNPHFHYPPPPPPS